jgi:hypothetical protein
MLQPEKTGKKQEMTMEIRSRFKPGQSGNPAGRRPGSGLAAETRALIAAAAPEIIAKLVERSKEGDTSAARLLLERFAPAIKPSEDPVTIDLGPGTLTEQGHAVMRAVSNGDLAPSQGAALLGALGTLGKLTEADELERRIAALEAHQKIGPHA